MKTIKYDRFVVHDPNAQEIQPIVKYITVQKGQLTIPLEFMKQLHWDIGTRVEMVFTPRYIVLKEDYRGLEIQKANSCGTGALWIGEIRSQITKNTGEPEFIPMGQTRCVCDLQKREIVYKQENQKNKEINSNDNENQSSRWRLYRCNQSKNGRSEESEEVQTGSAEA